MALSCGKCFVIQDWNGRDCPTCFEREHPNEKYLSRAEVEIVDPQCPEDNSYMLKEIVKIRENDKTVALCDY